MSLNSELEIPNSTYTPNKIIGVGQCSILSPIPCNGTFSKTYQLKIKTGKNPIPPTIPLFPILILIIYTYRKANTINKYLP